MLRVKYILLVKHFEGRASKDEEQEIELWRNENIVNNLTYQRLKRVWEENSKREFVSESQKEEKMWKNIFDKIISKEKPVQVGSK
jgi:ferric-dicitrate binding protein FerR (iron transport regulator)